jgi:hypothetical protein
MFVIGLMSWWYGRGWGDAARRVGKRLVGLEDYFSIDLLLKTLFSPYRQISAGKVQGALGVQMRAFFDRLISRLIGAMIRLFTILVGVLALAFYAVVGLLILIIWAVVPLLPIAGIVLFAARWIPWSL